MEIKNKAQFYNLYEKGFFGNRALAWKSLEELKKSGYGGLICIRGGIGLPREEVRYNIEMSTLEEVLEEYKRKGIKIKDLKFNQSMPDNRLLVQGEVMRSQRHLELTYSTVKKPMNQALKEKENHVYGLTAHLILKSNLWPSSFLDLEELFDLFNDSVIEFSSYSCAVGDIPNRNTVIWEVRNY